MEGDNQKVTVDELRKIRGLDDFDLIMLISEIHDHGWVGQRGGGGAKRTLSLMPEGKAGVKVSRGPAGL